MSDNIIELADNYQEEIEEHERINVCDTIMDVMIIIVVCSGVFVIVYLFSFIIYGYIQLFLKQ